MKKIVRSNLWLCTFILLSCSSASELPFDDTAEDSNCTIGYLKSLCHGTSTRITQDLTVHGIVTANDLLGEYRKTIVIEDADGGIEIAIDHPTLADDYPLNAELTVHCNGLALGDYGGKIQLGAIPTGEYSVDRIPRADIGRYIRHVEINSRRRRPTVRQFGEIGQRHIDTYTRFEGIRFHETDQLWCDSDPETGQMIATDRTIIDTHGATFRVRTLGSSQYATEPVPQGTGSVNGIIDYFNGEFTLRITNFEVDFATFAAYPTANLSVAEYSHPTPTR
ncbi:MAG: DUF5689 domain-containing protein [Alistipes sp.]